MTILEQAQDASERDINPRTSSLLLTGASGSGKTTVSCTGPAPRLLIDLDNRSDSVSGFADTKILKCFESQPDSPQAYDRLERIRKELWSLARKCSKDESKFPYGTVTVDGMTELFEVGMNWSLLLNPKRGLGGAPAEHHWWPQMHNVKRTIKSFIGLPCLVIFTGHEDLVEDKEDGSTCYLPKATGKLRTEIPKWFNETYYAWRSPHKTKTKFYLQTQGSGKREYLKSSINQLGSLWDDPVEVALDLQEMLTGKGKAKGILALIETWEKAHPQKEKPSENTSIGITDGSSDKVVSG